MRSPSMDSLIATGTGSAILYSLYATYKIYQGDIHYAHALYYESGVVILALILLGKIFRKCKVEKLLKLLKSLWI